MQAKLWEPEDLVSLPEFVELVWAADVAEKRKAGGDVGRLIEDKQAAIRMRRRNHPGFPEPASAAGRVGLYRMEELEHWWEDTRSSTSPSLLRVEDRPPAHWVLNRAVDACLRATGPEWTRLVTATVLAVAFKQTAISHASGRTRPKGNNQSRNNVTAAEHGDPSDLSEALDFGRGMPEALLDSAAPYLDPALIGPDGPLTALAVVARGARRGAEEIGAYASARLSGALVSTTWKEVTASEAFDAVLKRVSAPVRSGAAQSTPEGLAELVVATADPQPGQSFADLASGQGDILIATWARFPGLALYGRDADREAWALATIRFHLRDLHVLNENVASLGGPPPESKFDTVVLDPPLNKRRDLPRWLRLAETSLQQDGRAVVVLPLFTLDCDRPEWTEVGQSVEAVVKGPNRFRTDTGQALVLWVLRKNRATDDHLLVIDASSLGERRDTVTVLDTKDARRIGEALANWRNGRETPDPVGVTISRVPRELGELREVFKSMRAQSNTGVDRRPGAGLDPLKQVLRRSEELLQAVTDPALSGVVAKEDESAIRSLILRIKKAMEE